MSFSRRSILRGVAASALASPLALPLLARSAERASRKRLVVVFVQGGWDPTFTIDPKIGLSTIDGPELDEDPKNPDDREAIQTFGASPVAVNPVKRPEVTSFFEAWGAQTAIVNGIWTGSIAHQECAFRMLTGSRRQGSPDLAAIGGYSLGGDTPIPYLALGGTSYVGPLGAYAGRTGQVSQLRTLVDPATTYTPPADFPFRAYPQAVPTADDRDRVEQFLASRSAALRAERGGSPHADARLDAYDESLTRSRDLLADGPAVAETLFRTRGNFEGRIESAVASLVGGVCHTVSLDSGLPWDTHQNNALQHVYHNQLFGGLGYLMQRLQEESLLDDTVVWVFSEMMRTPKYNDNGGKDHWNVTSGMVLGGGVRGGVTLGATDDYQGARPVAVASGELWDKGPVLRYDHVAAGILQLLDVDPEAWLAGVEPLGGLQAAG